MKFSSIFQDHMILQREKPVPVQGTAGPGARISVSVQGKTAQGRADAQGNWCVTLPPLTASEAETLTATDGETVLTCEDIAVGEVWVAGGQSNMEFWMRYEKHRAAEGLSCPNPRLRFYDVPKVCYDGQLDEFDYSRMGVWRLATDADLDYFSAVAYYFQKELSADLDLPVGIIGCNWGGTVSAAWMNPETIARVGPQWVDWYAQVEDYRDREAYLAAQHGKPVNDHGNPFGDLFLETVLPRTLSDEEATDFLANLPGEIAAIYDDYMNHHQPQSLPGSLYEHMVKAVAPFPVRGVLWYQGEGDDEFGLAESYQAMLTGLIGDWRALWAEDSLPFLIVQIPGFTSWLGDVPGNNLMEIRRCQERVCDTVPDTWLCSASDAGDETDAHPKDKRSIGHRLALLARRHVYGEEVSSDAPRAVGARIETGPGDILRVAISFENAGDGLHIEGRRLNALRAADGAREYDYEADVSGDTLLVTLRGVKGGTLTLAFARTSWYSVNLYNSAGIPALPFERTLSID